VMAEASCWRYSRVPAGQLRIMQPSYTVGKAKSGRWEDGPGGNEKPTFVDAERDASRSENADGVSGNEIGYPTIDKEAGIINEGGYPTGGGTTTGMVLDWKGERILNGEKSKLKADGVQEGPKGISLLATSGHVGNELPLAEERRGAAISILKPMEQLGGQLSQTGALGHPSTDLGPILNTDAELHGRKSGAYSIANLGESDTPDEAVPGVADTERTGAPVLLGDKDGPSSEPNLGA
jgi:hypothetical protein